MEDQDHDQLEKLIVSACDGLRGDFSRLHGLFVATHSEMEASAIALNLMEFGRGQISGIEQPSESDRTVIEETVASIEVENELGYLFCAYVSGCVLGWVITGQLESDSLGPALALVQRRSRELFP